MTKTQFGEKMRKNISDVSDSMGGAWKIENNILTIRNQSIDIAKIDSISSRKPTRYYIVLLILLGVSIYDIATHNISITLIMSIIGIWLWHYYLLLYLFS